MPFSANAGISAGPAVPAAMPVVVAAMGSRGRLAAAPGHARAS